MLHHMFTAVGDGMDEDRIVKSATGIRNTVVWKKLYKFQRDGVVGVLDKLERFGGCIIADSVGLGKTFEALAIIKYGCGSFEPRFLGDHAANLMSSFWGADT